MGEKEISERCETKHCLLCKSKFLFQELSAEGREDLKFEIGYPENNEVVIWFSRWLRAVGVTNKKSMCFTCYMKEIYNIDSKYIKYGYTYIDINGNANNIEKLKDTTRGVYAKENR